MTFNDWRDGLVVVRGGSPDFRRFEAFDLGRGLHLSAQNNAYSYVTGRRLSRDTFDPDALADFEIAFWREGTPGGDLVCFEEDAEVTKALVEVGVDYSPTDTVIGYVPAEQVGRLLGLLRREVPGE